MLKNKSDKILLVGTFIFFLLGVSLFSYYEYHKHKTMLYQQIDEKLLASATGTNLLLGPDFHARAMNSSSIMQNEYNRNIDRLSEFAKSLQVAYLYTMVQKNNKIYFTASSATDEERRTGKNLTRYFDHYDDASDALNTAFVTHRITFDEYTDKWGFFRSIFVPLKTPEGHLYVVAADIEISEINKALREETLFLLARLLIVLAVSLPFLTFNFRRINETLVEDLKLKITEEKQAQERIEYLANFDLLTGLPNRIQFEDRITCSISLAKRHHQALSVMSLDLDHFKNINDTLGHRIGDILLVKLAERFNSVLREEDTVSRTGGDEFIFVLPQTDAKAAEIVAQKLLNSIIQPFYIEQNELIVTASIGITIFPTDGTDHETLSKNADTAMYRAKQEGRNTYTFFTKKIQVHSTRTLQLSNALHHALERHQLYVVYQPQVSLENGYPRGRSITALGTSRTWNHISHRVHPDRGR